MLADAVGRFQCEEHDMLFLRLFASPALPFAGPLSFALEMPRGLALAPCTWRPDQQAPPVTPPWPIVGPATRLVLCMPMATAQATEEERR